MTSCSLYSSVFSLHLKEWGDTKVYEPYIRATHLTQATRGHLRQAEGRATAAEKLVLDLKAEVAELRKSLGASDTGVEQLNVTCQAIHPPPYTLHPTPSTLHPTSYTLHPTPYTLHPKP